MAKDLLDRFIPTKVYVIHGEIQSTFVWTKYGKSFTVPIHVLSYSNVQSQTKFRTRQLSENNISVCLSETVPRIDLFVEERGSSISLNELQCIK